MAARKFLFMAVDGFSEEAAAADSTTLGALTMGGNIDMNSAGKIIGSTAASQAGDALVYGQTSANLGDLTIASAGDITVSGDGELVGLPTVPSGSTAATSKAYVDGLISGIGWKEPVISMGLVGNLDVASINGLTPTAGDAYVVTDADTITLGSISTAIGDIVEYNGTIWIRIEAGAGGFVADGVRIVLSEQTTLIAPYTDATDNDKIMAFDGTSLTGTSTGDTVDKASVLVQDNAHVGYYDNLAFVYEGTVPSGTWIQFTGTGQINAGTGMTKDGNTLNVIGGDGIVANQDDIAVDLGTNPGLQFTSNKLVVKIDDTPDTLDVDADGLKVVGLPSLFKINDVAVGASVTTANLDDVLDGSSADSLHTHTGSSVSLNHSDLGSVTADQHHNQSHVLDGGDHTVSGLTTGHILTATGATTFAFAAPGASEEAQRIENALVAVENVAKADPVYWGATADKFGKGDAAVDAKAYIFGIAKDAILADATGEVVSYGPAAGVLTGATPGAKYYLQASGGIGTSVPAGGNRIIMIGWAMNATTLWVQPIDFGKKAA